MVKDAKSFVERHIGLVFAVVFFLTIALPVTLGFSHRCFGPVGKIGWLVLIAWFDWHCGFTSYTMIHLAPLVGAVAVIVLAKYVPIHYRKSIKIIAWTFAVSVALSLLFTIISGYLLGVYASAWV